MSDRKLQTSADEELHGLVEKLVSETISPAEFAQLEGRLHSDPAAQDFYLAVVDLQARLRWLARGSDAANDGVQTPANDLSPPTFQSATAVSEQRTILSESNTTTPVPGFLGRATAAFNRPVYWAMLAAGVLFAGYFIVVSWNMLGRKLPNGTDGNELAVAFISDTQDAQWSGVSAPRLSHGGKGTGAEEAAIKQGEPLKIDSGLVELELKQGTTLIVEGPAEWSIDGGNQATLNRGKLVAKVPQQAVGFTLNTPTTRIVDLGTEFGVEIKPNGEADVHVSKGKVDVQSAGGSGKPGPGKLQAGQSVQITSEGAQLTSDPAIAEKFKQLAEKNKKSSGDQSSRYADCVRALEPLVYLPIERKDGLTLADHAGGKFIGKFTRTEGPGDAWEKGPFGDALRFRGNKVSDRVTIEPKDPQDAGSLTFSRGKEPGKPFTIALWARCQPGQSTGTLVGKGAGFQEQYLFDILSGKYRLVTVSADRKTLGEIYSLTPFDGTWQHVAATFDPEQKSISLYVNGNREGHAALQDVTLFATDEETYIGNRPFRGDHNKLTLDGALDEVAIFPRALTDAEINAMYRLQPVRNPAAK